MSAPYAWMITKDRISTANADVGIIGPYQPDPPGLVRQLLDGQGQRFQMFDDDDILYYEGLIVGDYTGFEPLDDFGRPGAGCTYIKLHNPTTDLYETL